MRGISQMATVISTAPGTMTNAPMRARLVCRLSSALRRSVKSWSRSSGFMVYISNPATAAKIRSKKNETTPIAIDAVVTPQNIACRIRAYSAAAIACSSLFNIGSSLEIRKPSFSRSFRACWRDVETVALSLLAPVDRCAAITLYGYFIQKLYTSQLPMQGGF